MKLLKSGLHLTQTMNFLPSNTAVYLTLYLLCIVVIVVALIVTFSKLKKKSNEHLSLISEDIQHQEKLYPILHHKVNESRIRESETRKKIQDIRFDLVQIDYSYQELMKQLVSSLAN